MKNKLIFIIIFLLCILYSLISYFSWHWMLCSKPDVIVDTVYEYIDTSNFIKDYENK